ncbi:SufE family protein [Sandaracinomonas limnophila]|uniref:SufE family protein n=1 Tax=Sandaracinomonas limnophila TaxID=1862386 RepID=A0A437PW32_9BACT|nr:SufE family protein [Sandaracinomonas limnophila]RVU26456.1 SufE family protein [Sandaracinomonas limnophila]
MAKNINQIQDSLIEEFGLFEDWTEKYEYLIDLGKKLSPMAEALKTEDNVIKGCQSKVWLSAKFEEGKVIFEADSEAVIVKGLISMLIRVLSNQTPQDILQADLYFIDEIGMSQHLAQTRSNGLLAMVKQMKNYALAFSLKD